MVTDVSKEKKPKLFLLFALLTGTGLGLFAGLVFHRPFFTVLASIGGFIAGIVIFRPKKKRKRTVNEDVKEISKEYHETTVKEGYEKLSKLRALVIKIDNKSVKEKADAVCGMIEKILETVKRDPKDLKPARSFFNYYLDTTMNILLQYNEIFRQNIRSEETEEVIEKVKSVLGKLEQALEQQRKQLLENNILTLDTELAVLERTIEMEGLGKNFTNTYQTKERNDE
jgi:5-bromo-4-chloroindolyl phosphate hydrolysis protein